MSYADSSSLSTILEQYTYGYDKNSNIISETIINNYPAKQEERVNETRTYAYDSLNRMIISKRTDNISQTVSNASYTYDKVGNCTKSVEDGVTTYSTYNSLNQLVYRDVSKNGARVGLTFYSYDANGNQILEQTMVSPPTITETIEKEYDTNNQLTKVTCREGNASGPIKYTQENTYNYDGQRISKSDNGVTTNYYYQGGVLLYTTDNSGNKTSQNVVGPQENVIATIRYEEDGQHAYFYNKDSRTSVTNVVDESGSSVVSYRYDDYGSTTRYGDKDFYNEICYTSGVYDELTGLYYLNARYYNPGTATFITQDSYRGEQSDYGTWNLYAYCGGNPVNDVDPSGHGVDTVVDIGGLTYDTYSFIKDPKLENAAFVVVDLVCTVVPMFTCGGSSKFVVKRGFSTISKAVKKAKNTITTGIKKIGKRILSWFGGKKTAKKAAKKVVTSSKKKVNIELKYNAKWTKDQRKQAKAKVRMLSKNKTVKTKVTKRGNQTKTFRKKAPEVPFRCDVDHIIDLQLGGADSFKNMWFLDSSVNRSLGVQISNAIKKYDIGTEFGRFKIK